MAQSYNSMPMVAAPKTSYNFMPMVMPHNPNRSSNAYKHGMENGYRGKHNYYREHMAYPQWDEGQDYQAGEREGKYQKEQGLPPPYQRAKIRGQYAPPPKGGRKRNTRRRGKKSKRSRRTRKH